MLEAGGDPYDASDFPQSLVIAGTIAATAAFVTLAYLTDDSRPFFGAVFTGVIFALISLLWSLRNRKMVWVLISMVAVTHAALLVFLKFPSRVSIGIAFTPLVCLDIWLFWRIILWVLKRTEMEGR